MKFLLASLTLSFCLCGTLGASNGHRRFHHGEEAAEADPYFASLIRKPFFWPLAPLEYKCAGTWIHAIYVLTAASCLKYQDVNRVGYLKGQETFWANGFKLFDIDGKHYYGNYSVDGVKKFENDIGLVKVRRKIPGYPSGGIGRRSDAPFPVGPFPRIFNDWGNTNRLVKHEAVLYGFGRNEQNINAPKLKYMRGHLHFSDDYSRDKCTVPSCSMGLSFCFEPQGSKLRADKEDMGSPVYYKLENPAHPKLTDRVIIGVLSDYHKDPRNIILTNLTSYQSWINSIIHK